MIRTLPNGLRARVVTPPSVAEQVSALIRHVHVPGRTDEPRRPTKRRHLVVLPEPEGR